MSRLLFVMTDLTVGGAQRVLLHLIRGLREKGEIADIFLLKNQGEFMADIPAGTRVFTGPRGRLLFNGPKTLAMLAGVAKNYDVIIGGLELVPSYFAKAAAAMTGKPFIGWVHTTIERYLKDYSDLARAIAKRFYLNCENLVFVSEGARRSMSQFCGRPPGANWLVIHNGVPDTFFDQQKQTTVSERPGKVRVIFVGRLEPMKRLDVLVDAHVLANRAGAAHQLLIVGDGPEMAKLISARDRFHAECDITLKGNSDNVIPLLDEADVFVLSSEFEGLPTVIIEAMARGLPIISTNCESGPAELLRDGEDGILCEVNSAVALSQALISLVTDSGAREIYRAKSLARSRDFLVGRVAEHWQEIIVMVVRA
jgi:glycosyltransferase involved in cell wall biosynthesis